MENNVIAFRLAALREVMRRERLDAFVFPSTDPHNSEYTPDRWKGREWISGFNGSAGTAVVTRDAAALWTDSRYFLSAAEQLEGTEFQLMRQKMPGTPSIVGWLGQQLRDKNAQVGVDGMVCAEAEVEALTAGLRRQGGITVRTNFDPLREIWTGRPAIPGNKVCVQPVAYAGETAASKIARVRRALREAHADGMLVSALDEVAWLLNLRGSDVHCNPVFVAYVIISTSEVTLYINKEKLTPMASAALAAAGVGVRGYDEVGQGLKDYFEYNILLDPQQVCHTLFHKVRVQEVVRQPSPISALKAVKNEAEIAGFRRAMLRDGVAMVRFLRWLHTAVLSGGQTEMSVARKLTSLRAVQPLFKDISFDTIAGYDRHGAIVHYEATPATDMAIKPRGFLLLDSGAHYQDGTTDITRTIALGPLTDEERKVYTLVLKGHIQLELCKFPDGACGTQLDALAREAMWREGMNYLHGTGHGVGAYLNVHEGPHQIRMEYVPAPLHAGMVVTDEPGLYIPDRFGVRIENMLLVRPYRSTEFGDFLEMESLTLCPIDTSPVITSMLMPEEREWLNAYHHRVFAELSVLLDDAADVKWLKEATQPV